MRIRKKTMVEDIKALEANQTWILIPLSPNKKTDVSRSTKLNTNKMTQLNVTRFV